MILRNIYRHHHNGRKISTVLIVAWHKHNLIGDLPTTTGEELLDMVDSAPIIAVKSLKVSDFQGMLLIPFQLTYIWISLKFCLY